MIAFSQAFKVRRPIVLAIPNIPFASERKSIKNFVDSFTVEKI